MEHISQDTVISLITCHPGEIIYELEGHSAVRIKTPEHDVAVNYGLFEFNAPNFMYRFVKGETDYWTGAYDFGHFLNSYARQGRKVVEQQLDLTSEQKSRLIGLVQENLRPENSVYRYNYVKDNCATRPLRLIENALGDTVTFHTPADSLHATFRDAMTHYHTNYPWYQFGIDLALGSGIDYRISPRENAFAPVMLEQLMESATVDGRPVVARTEVLSEYIPGAGPLSPTPFVFTPLAASLLVFAVALWTSIRQIRKKTIGRIFDSIFFGAEGLAGLLLTFLIFVSSHEATSPNWLYLWLNPLALAVPIFCWLKSCKIVVMSYHFLNFVTLCLMALLWQIIPQSMNMAFIQIGRAHV